MNPILRWLGRASLLSAALLAGTMAATVPATAAGPIASTSSRADAVIKARRNLMAAIGRNMDGITGMVEPGGTLDAADASEHADEIAVMLGAFAHLFPAGTDNWSAQRERDDPAGVSEAAAAVWRESARFQALAGTAAQIATDASRAHDAAQFRQRAAALQASCDGCHAQFRREEKPYTMPIPPLPSRQP